MIFSYLNSDIDKIQNKKILIVYLIYFIISFILLFKYIAKNINDPILNEKLLIFVIIIIFVKKEN